MSRSNNNRFADDFADLATRRAYVATISGTPKTVLAWPTAERLSRLASPEAARALYRYAELTGTVEFVAANDNDGPCEEMQTTNIEMTIETRPGIDETLRAASDGLRARVVVERPSGRIVARHVPRLGFADADFQLGNLTFRSGVLLSFGTKKRGAELRPRDMVRRPRGAVMLRRSDSCIRTLVRSEAPIAEGSGWLGGITRPRGNTTRADVGEAQADAEIQRNARCDAVRLALGAEATRVLDLACTDATAQEIGELFGLSGKRAERQAVGMINTAIKKFQEIAA